MNLRCFDHSPCRWSRLVCAEPRVSAFVDLLGTLLSVRHSGGIGQPLSLLLKLNPLITELTLYDVVNAVGVSLAVSLFYMSREPPVR